MLSQYTVEDAAVDVWLNGRSVCGTVGHWVSRSVGPFKVIKF